MLTHRNVYLHALHVCLTFDPTRDFAQLHTIPLFHANGWGVAHILALIGGKHVILRRFDCAQIFRLIEEERNLHDVSCARYGIALVNSPDRQKYDLSTSRESLLVESIVPNFSARSEEKLGVTCISGYGLTETSPALSHSSSSTDLTARRGEVRAPSHERFADPGTEMRVADDRDVDVRAMAKPLEKLSPAATGS